MPDVTEKNLESAIECVLLAGGPDACPGVGSVVREAATPYGDAPLESGVVSGGYHRRSAADYDEELCLIPDDVIAFIQATQPKQWEKLKKQYREGTREHFVKFLARQIAERGTLDVLRKGVKDRGAKFRLLYFRPPSTLNPTLQQQYRHNLFTVVRQLTYSVKDKDSKHRKSLDMGLFLNGIPLFTVELKNPLTGQTYHDAIRQYKTSRNDPKEPLFAFGRCLAHFAVDPDEVWFTTHLRGDETIFFPFNQGRNGGAGNPIPARSSGRFATAYLWEQTWAKDSILDLLEHFIHIVPLTDDKGNPTGEEILVFPRYHQLETVRRLLADARNQGAGRRYLIQHSAGSGKTFTIAWLTHQLATLHDAADQPVFSSVVVITDRRVLDRQLQHHVSDFEQVPGLVENISSTSRQLKKALEEGKRIIVTTLQKFPVISDEIKDLPGQRFAIVIDEAHSSQSGEQSRHLKEVLSAGSLEAAAAEEDVEGEDWEDEVVKVMLSRGQLPNVSTFAFTATPKSRTLELFGTPQPDGEQPGGSFRPFSLYSMRQAIQEEFIRDVLENYTTYRAYWHLLKKAEDDPKYERKKAVALLRSYVELHEHAVEQKVATMVEHFHTQVAHHIHGEAKAMIVTRSRLHAVRYKLALDRYLRERGYPYQSLVAFSGTVTDPDSGIRYTETGMNGVPESQTEEAFKRAEMRFLVVANKFQTGFNQPRLTAMYVDKRLGGVNAVQTLSRLNRTRADKRTTYVLDFANEADAIEAAFSDYYETTLLTAATDPNLLYDLERKLADAQIYTQDEVDHLAKVWYAGDALPDAQRHADIHNALQPAVDRFKAANEDAQEAFRGTLKDYVRLYSFLAQLLTFVDTDLEKLYRFGRLLLKRLPWERDPLPMDVLDDVDLDTYQLRRTHNGGIALERNGGGALDPQGEKGGHHRPEDELLPLSQILTLLNDYANADIPEKEGVQFITDLQTRLAEDESLAQTVRVNPEDRARLTFDHIIGDRIQDMVDVSFKFYKLLNDDPDFARFFQEVMFKEYLKAQQGEEAGTSG